MTETPAPAVGYWQIAPVRPDPPTLRELRAHYESLASWELRTRASLDMARDAYARTLLAGRPGDRAGFLAKGRAWHAAVRALRLAERTLTARLLLACPVDEEEAIDQA